jgi:hypothetical protein
LRIGLNVPDVGTDLQLPQTKTPELGGSSPSGTLPSRTRCGWGRGSQRSSPSGAAPGGTASKSWSRIVETRCPKTAITSSASVIVGCRSSWPASPPRPASRDGAAHPPVAAAAPWAGARSRH